MNIWFIEIVVDDWDISFIRSKFCYNFGNNNSKEYIILKEDYSTEPFMKDYIDKFLYKFLYYFKDMDCIIWIDIDEWIKIILERIDKAINNDRYPFIFHNSFKIIDLRDRENYDLFFKLIWLRWDDLKEYPYQTSLLNKSEILSSAFESIWWVFKAKLYNDTLFSNKRTILINPEKIITEEKPKINNHFTLLKDGYKAEWRILDPDLWNDSRFVLSMWSFWNLHASYKKDKRLREAFLKYWKIEYWLYFMNVIEDIQFQSPKLAADFLFWNSKWENEYWVDDEWNPIDINNYAKYGDIGDSNNIYWSKIDSPSGTGWLITDELLNNEISNEPNNNENIDLEQEIESIKTDGLEDHPSDENIIINDNVCDIYYVSFDTVTEYDAVKLKKINCSKMVITLNEWCKPSDDFYSIISEVRCKELCIRWIPNRDFYSDAAKYICWFRWSILEIWIDWWTFRYDVLRKLIKFQWDYLIISWFDKLEDGQPEILTQFCWTKIWVHWELDYKQKNFFNWICWKTITYSEDEKITNEKENAYIDEYYVSDWGYDEDSEFNFYSKTTIAEKDDWNCLRIEWDHITNEMAEEYKMYNWKILDLDLKHLNNTQVRHLSNFRWDTLIIRWIKSISDDQAENFSHFKWNSIELPSITRLSDRQKMFLSYFWGNVIINCI